MIIEPAVEKRGGEKAIVVYAYKQSKQIKSMINFESAQVIKIQ